MSHFDAVDARGPPLKKCQRADFDAFSRPRMRRGGGILEGGVGGPARTAVLHRIKHLEYIGLLAPHAREPVPLVFRIVLHPPWRADRSPQDGGSAAKPG